MRMCLLGGSIPTYRHQDFLSIPVQSAQCSGLSLTFYDQSIYVHSRHTKPCLEALQLRMFRQIKEEAGQFVYQPQDPLSPRLPTILYHTVLSGMYNLDLEQLGLNSLNLDNSHLV